MECQICGRPTTLLIGGQPICEECYQEVGSCCPEFGGDDLWQQRDNEPGSGHPDSAQKSKPLNQAAAGQPPSDSPAFESAADSRARRS